MDGDMEKNGALKESVDDFEDLMPTDDLIITSTASVTKKDFRFEVRGLLDVDHLLEDAIVLLDIEESGSESIIDRLLDTMVDNKETVTKPEIKTLLFSDSDNTRLSHTIQCAVPGEGGGTTADPTWIGIYADVPTLLHRRVGIARLARATNMAESAHAVKFVILILAPQNVKGTKSSLETGRTFSTLFSDMQLRHTLLECSDGLEVKGHIRKQANEASNLTEKKDNTLQKEGAGKGGAPRFLDIGRGIRDDLARRLPYYLSDYKDGVIGNKAVQKTVSTTFFLYFSILLPAIAFGNLQDGNTSSRINVEKVLIGQVFGGLIFSIFAGQPLVVVMTTAPLVLFTKIILNIADDFEISFLPFYAMVGLWNSFFLIIYSVFNLSILMKFSSRSTEEIFSNFISIALTVDAIKHLVASFNQHYTNEVCWAQSNKTVEHTHDIPSPIAVLDRTRRALMDDHDIDCDRSVSLLHLILMLGTVWFGLMLFDFVKTPYLSARKREILSDYALPVAVIVFSAIGTGLFSSVPMTPFSYEAGQFDFSVVKFSELSVSAVFLAGVLGFSLSLLFFMDQNISAAMVNSPENRLKKGNAYHWDLVVVSVINAILSIFGLPFMHAVLPHSPLHVRCLADVETRVEGGYARDVVTHVRETRLTNIFSNIFIGLSLLFLPTVLPYVPKAVLDGLFLYMAATALYGNQMFERFCLLFTEQAAYPPHHYVKRVPQKKIHTFTGCQLVQLLVLCVFGFTPWPYMKMIFPVVILVFLPIRHKLIPRIVEAKFLDAIDPTSL